MTGDLFAPTPPVEPWPERLGPGAVLHHGFVIAAAPALVVKVARILEQAPWRHMITPSGHCLSVAMTHCGALEWVSDHTSYRYGPLDPETGRPPWPPMQARFFQQLAHDAVAQAGVAGFLRDACLIIATSQTRAYPCARTGTNRT